MSIFSARYMAIYAVRSYVFDPQLLDIEDRELLNSLESTTEGYERASSETEQRRSGRPDRFGRKPEHRRRG